MKLNFFVLAFFILFAQSLWRAASESSFKPKNRDFNLSNRLLQRQDVQGANQNFTGQFGKDDDGTRYKENENLVYSMKAKGKGAVGGGNVAHHPQDSRSIALGPVKPSLFSKIIIACVTLCWFFGYRV